MDLIQAVTLGLVEGATEFIPVSSTGHLIVVGQWLGVDDERGKTFEIFIQLGAILAVVWLYRDLLRRTLRDQAAGGQGRRLVINLILAFLPAAAVGFLAHHWIKAHLFSPLVVAGAMTLGGVAILGIEAWSPRLRTDSIDGVPGRTAFGIGLAQLLALVPGVSRSGATIMGGYGLGLSRPAAAEFSFLLAIPTMAAATGYDLLKSLDQLSPADLPAFALGFVTSFFSALVVVRWLIGFVARNDFRGFAWYRIAAGLALLIWYWPRMV